MDRITLERLRRALAQPPAGSGTEAGPDPAAAVAAILREQSSDVEVLLIRRAAHQGDPWSGQMGLPGGRREPGDQDLLATATRETREEVGLDLAGCAELLGALPAVVARARAGILEMTVTPFVFALTGPASPEPGAEVEEVVWTELTPLARGQRKTTLATHWDGRTVSRPAWDVDGRIVWGLTYQMLRSLFDALEATPP